MTGASAGEAASSLQRLKAATPRGQTFSVGIAVWDGAESPEELLDRADRALYAAKRAGRDRVVVAGSAGAQDRATSRS
jgi:diguanylate cyclase